MTLNLTPRRPAEELHALADQLVRRGIAAARDNSPLGSHLIGLGIVREGLACRIDAGAVPFDADLQHELATKDWA